MNSVIAAILTWLKSLAFAPAAYLRWIAANRANDSGDWDGVVKHIERVHEWGWVSDNSRFLLGCAYTGIERHDEAVRQLKAINGTLRPHQCEQERWLNLASSLNQLGDPRAALEFLPESAEIPTVFPDYANRAMALYENIAERAAYQDKEPL